MEKFGAPIAVSSDGTCFVLGKHPFQEVALYKLKLDGFHHFKKVMLKDKSDLLK